MQKINYLSCRSCPRNCSTNRIESNNGYCKSDNKLNIASICIHQGEEPVLGGEFGVCNIFFQHCNLQCLYCQNFQISRNDSNLTPKTLEEIITKISSILDTGINHLGFVSPSHNINQMIKIIETLHKKGYNPTTIYNSSGYDQVSTLKSIEKYIDIYLPDFKYSDERLGRLYSLADNYPEISLKALREMYRQKGPLLKTDEKGLALSGIIIRHLILPNHPKNSIDIFKKIAEELSTSVHISLMSQYQPTEAVQNHPDLGRKITLEEFTQIESTINELGFNKGWIQDPEDNSQMLPDFSKNKPFE